MYAKAGELIVGAYLKAVDGVDWVVYNQGAVEDKDGINVLGLTTRNSDLQCSIAEEEWKKMYGCEVITQLGGMLFEGSPQTERWNSFGGDDCQYTLERLWDKFRWIDTYTQTTVGAIGESNYQLWSPVVLDEELLDGLDKLVEDFEDEYGVEIEMVINEEYKNRIDELQIHADGDTKDYGEPGFRFFQIIENI